MLPGAAPYMLIDSNFMSGTWVSQIVEKIRDEFLLVNNFIDKMEKVLKATTL